MDDDAFVGSEISTGRRMARQGTVLARLAIANVSSETIERHAWARVSGRPEPVQITGHKRQKARASERAATARVHGVALQPPVPRRPLLLLPRPHDLGRLLAPDKVGIDHVVGQQDVAHVALGLGAIEEHDVVPAERLVAPPAAEDWLGRDDVRRAAPSERKAAGHHARDDRAAHVHVLEEVGNVILAQADLAARCQLAASVTRLTTRR